MFFYRFRCFLALLLVAAILWKIKQKYDMYRRRQRLFVEMEQMASRAFSQVFVEIERREFISTEMAVDDSELVNSKKKKKKKVGCRSFLEITVIYLLFFVQSAPSPIALEPCCGNRAAVLSLLVRLPTGGESYTPVGQSAGLAIASALVTLGNPRRSSHELTIRESKKTRKYSNQHPESTCI